MAQRPKTNKPNTTDLWTAVTSIIEHCNEPKIDSTPKGKLFIWVLCYKNYKAKNTVSEVKPTTACRWNDFVRVCQPYIKKTFPDLDLKPFDTSYSANSRSDLDNQALIMFNEWFDTTKERLEMEFCSNYAKDGKNSDLEILKRRYKDNWAEDKKGQQTQVNVDNENKTFQIMVTDYADL
ncbi:MAG: hypothetical protein IKG26_09105 [Bacillus sp. (in: Bacteria)]|nr:hypothetical protein [Bacillus sp. (in: firmicutes)]